MEAVSGKRIIVLKLVLTAGSDIVLFLAPLVNLYDIILVMEKTNVETITKMMREGFEESRTYMDMRFDAMDERFDAMDMRFDAMDQRFDTMDQRFNTLEQEVRYIRTELSEVKKRIDNLEHVEGFAKEIDWLVSKVAMLEKRLDEQISK